MKRAFDLCGALAGLVLTGPVFFVVWVMIKLDDGGPLFYRQTRVGQSGRLFRIVKFRTMNPGADKAGPSITASGDHRVTRAGRVLRKAKLDELPQLWNVLRGEMSLVGPRPEVPRYVELYTADQREVLRLKPGITDEASLAFRDEEQMLAQAGDAEKFYVERCMPEKIRLNLAYARSANLWRDCAVIGRTVWNVWMHRQSRQQEIPR